MKTTRLFLFLLFALPFFSCSESESDSCTLSVRLLLPEEYRTLSLEDVKVSLTNKNQGNVYTSACSTDGIAVLHVEYGYYTAAVHYQTQSGLVFNGRLESLSLLPGQDVTTAEISLVRSRTNALVIKEVYYGGCLGTKGEGYQVDQYVTLCNNSDEVVYLDGLCVAVVDPPSNLQSPWMKYTDMARIPVNDMTWQFPGNGQEFPLAPGEETTIATNAVDHTGGAYQQANSVDLSKVDWGFWDASLLKQNITPGVKPMRLVAKLNPSLVMYSLPTVGPTVMVFKIEGIAVEDYINNPGNRESRPRASNKNKVYLMIPKGWVIDCIECVENVSQMAFKRVPDELDNGAAYIPQNPYTGKSLVRKIVIDGSGRAMYQDSNNSTDDMVVSLPTLKNK